MNRFLVDVNERRKENNKLKKKKKLVGKIMIENSKLMEIDQMWFVIQFSFPIYTNFFQAHKLQMRICIL